MRMGRHQPKKQIQKNIPIRVAALLFCMTLLSTYFVAGLFARYTTSAQSSDHARVATFSISGGEYLSETVTIEANLFPDNGKDVNLVIQNDSEVAVEYKIEVTNVTNNLPLSFSMEKKGSSPDITGNGTTFTAQQIPGNHIDSYTLKIKWPTDDGNLALMGMVDYITVTVMATQID